MGRVMLPDQTVSDFAVGDRVQHVFYGTYGTVEKVGRKLLTVELYDNKRITWRPTSVRKVS